MVTGSAGFIGYHVSRALLDQGKKVLGIDDLNDYYTPQLKKDRNARLHEYPGYEFRALNLCERESLKMLCEVHTVTQICHLAAQAGVRHSLTHPHLYPQANVEGFLNVLECARCLNVPLVFAS